jgi:hypothetical protein
MYYTLPEAIHARESQGVRHSNCKLTKLTAESPTKDSMGSTNPYNYNLPVEPEMFFGRHADVEALAEGLVASHGDSVALIGGRRMGKTSILEALLRNIASRAYRSPADCFPLPILLDLSGEGIVSPQTFFLAIGEAVREKLSTQLPVPLMLLDIHSNAPPVPSFRGMLEAWNQVAMAHLGRRLRLILLLDECEEIVGRPWAAEIHAALRALLVGQTTRILIKVVMAGSHRFLSEVHHRGSPLWNVLTYHFLRVFDESETRALILQPIGGDLSDKVVKSIIKHSGGHPRLTQYLMYKLWAYGLERVTLSTVSRYAMDFSNQVNDFSDWTNSLGESGIIVYNALIQTKTPISEEKLHSIMHSPPADFSQALSALCYHGLMVRDEVGDYQIAGRMFHDWFVTHIKDRSRTSFIEESGVAKDPREHLHAVLREKQRRLQQREVQAAQLGFMVDPAVTNEIEDIRREIAGLERQIREMNS